MKLDGFWEGKIIEHQNCFFLSLSRQFATRSVYNEEDNHCHGDDSEVSPHIFDLLPDDVAITSWIEVVSG